MEPQDVGPLYGGDLPILESDGQMVMTLLRAAHSDGRISDFEVSTRLQRAQFASTFDDLVPITRDLMSARR